MLSMESDQGYGCKVDGVKVLGLLKGVTLRVMAEACELS